MIDATSVADNWRIIPENRKEFVNLFTRTGDGATSTNYAAAVQWRARRRPVKLSTALLLGNGVLNLKFIEFHLFQLDGQTVIPAELDKIVDAASVTWQVIRVEDMFFALQWRCYCQANL